LDSLVKQSLGSIEILAVDNNSSDDSYKIIQQYAKKYKTIRPLFCKKAGVSAARNMGMKSAKGEFLAFCDSDDYAELNMCEELYKQAKESESDLVVCDYYLDNQDGNMQPVSCGLENRSSNIKKNYLSSITVAPWNKLIKRSLIIDNKLFFEEGIIYEDLGVVPAYILYAKKCSYVKRPLYHYVCRADSIINSGRKPNADIFVAIDSLYDIFLRNNAVEKYHAELEFIFIRHLLHNAASRYLPHRELREDNLKRIREIMRGKFPGWRKNVYYATMPGRYKLLCFMIYTGTHWVLLVGSYIKKMIRS
jgi:glycosyltransferase involved in cell wall biosynthesis